MALSPWSPTRRGHQDEALGSPASMLEARPTRKSPRISRNSAGVDEPKSLLVLLYLSVTLGGSPNAVFPKKARSLYKTSHGFCQMWPAALRARTLPSASFVTVASGTATNRRRFKLLFDPLASTHPSSDKAGAMHCALVSVDTGSYKPKTSM